MGLAASQARFLAITSRKASCEFRSQQIAQQELSLSRDMEEISEEYQDALNQTQLVWDPDGNGTDLYDLSYNIMMTPSELNNYEPFMLSRRDGKIALNSQYAAAAEAAGLDEKGGLSSGTDKKAAYQKFIEALGNNHMITSSVTIDTLKNGYIEKAGVGEELYGRECGGKMTLTSLISYIDLLTEGAEDGSYPVGSSEYEQAQTLIYDWSYTSGTTEKTIDLETSWNKDFRVNTDGATAVLINGSYDNSSFNLADLLNEDITLLTTNKTNLSTVIETIRNVLKNTSDNSAFDTIINNDVQTWYNAAKTSGNNFENLTAYEQTVLTYVDTLAKGMFSLLMPDEDSRTDQDLNAFYVAMDDLLNRLEISSGSSASILVNESWAKSAVQEAENYNTWYTKGNNHAISLSNLTESFLTNFVNGLNGYSEDYIIKDKVKNSSYITDDAGAYYNVNSNSDTDATLYISEFYSIIFNNIYENGWYENENVNDKDYLDNAIKTGQLFVTSQGSDYYYYQERYVNISGGHISENTDSDAVARAEVEYQNKKSKINTKEEQLELEMKQLDAEISSLTTEYDTVKSLISKNIEKTFTLFNN